MAVRSYKPTSPARRFYSVLTFDEITTSTPHKPLVENLKRTGGRNNHGELTSWWRGGGHKRAYRIIDFKRADKDGVPATVAKEAFRLADAKLPFHCRFIAREGVAV